MMSNDTDSNDNVGTAKERGPEMRISFLSANESVSFDRIKQLETHRRMSIGQAEEGGGVHSTPTVVIDSESN
jgi:hypothetical protein